MISNRDLPHGLTESGIVQAKELAYRLSGKGITKVFCSPIPRARQTAQIVAEELEVECEISDALREFDCGIFEGRGDSEAWAAHAKVHREWYEEHRHEARIEGGESYRDIRDRLLPWVTNLLETSHANDVPLLVSHGGTLCCVLPLLLENVDQAAVTKNGLSYTGMIEAEVAQDRLRCVAWNGQPYL